MGRGKDLLELLTSSGVSWKGLASPKPSIFIEGLNYDSRLVQKGDLFFAMKGVHVDGHDFLNEVAKKGASAALVEREVPSALPQIKVSSVLTALSPISNKFFDEPSKKIPVVGITGTNGKTTITYL